MAEGLLGPGAGLDITEPVAGLGLLGDDVAPKGPGARGFATGVAGVKAAGRGALALGARIVGAPGAEARALTASRETLEASAPDVMRVEDVSSPGEAVDFTKYALGTALPSIALMVGGGVVGRAVGSLLARRASAVATRELLKTSGMVVGAGASSLGLEAGSIFPEAIETGVENPAARAIVGGGAAAALDILAPAYLAARTGLLGGAGQAVKPRKAGFGAVAKGAVTEGAKTAVIEGLTEATQEAIEAIAAGKDPSSPEGVSAMLNALAIGAIAGKTAGTGVGALTTAARPIEQPPAPLAPPAAPTPTPETPLPGLTVGQDQFPDIRDFTSPLLEDALPAAPDAGSPRSPTIDSYARTRAPIAEDADLTELSILRAREEDVIQQRTALDEELALPQDKRRTKEAILKDARALDTQIGYERTQIGVLEQQIRNRVAYQETPAEVKPKGTVTPEGEVIPRESGAFKQTIPEVDTAPAELAVARTKQEKGELMSAREAKLLRAAEKGKPAAPTVQPVGGRQPRERFQSITPERQVEVIEGVAEESINRHLEGLAFRQGTRDAARAGLQRAIAEAAKAPTIEAAEKAIHGAAIRALAGKVNKADAETFAQAIAADVRSAPTFYSKGAIEPGSRLHNRAAVRTAARTKQPLYARTHYGTWVEVEGPYVVDRSHINTANGGRFSQDDLRTVETLRTYKPSRAALAPTKLSDLTAHVPALMRAHATTGGSSTNLVTGQNLAGTDNYAVSIFKPRELKILGHPTSAQIREYIAANADLLSDPQNMLGTWYNPKDGYTYVDVSVLVPTVGAAIQLGRQHKQIAVFYLGTFDTIPIGSAEVFDIAQQYNSRAGLTPAVAIDYIPVPVERMKLIAEAYDWLRDNATLRDERIAIAYEQFIQETEAQFAFVSQYINIEPWRQEGQPYKNSAAMMQDVAKNKHLWVYEGGDPHPVMMPEQNWKFRAVHGIFGHAKTGFEFGPRGELNATRAHAQMYSQAAWPPLVTETIGQNAWVNFGEANEGKVPAERAYAKQKADILPAGMWRDLLDEPVRARDASLDQHDLIIASKGQDLVAHLKGMLGDDPNLEVRLYQAAPDEAIGSYTRTDSLKSVISMALNSKHELSVADHEGFHYLEDRVLDGRERVIISRQLRPGANLFNRLLEKTRAYDLENKTNLTDEILSVPQEARAYGYEFWKRGELQVDGTLATIYEKIRQFLERVRNYIDGLGFQSIEDIFRAIDRGQYAQRGAAFRTTEADTDWISDVEPDVVPGLRSFQRKEGAASKAKGRPFWVRHGNDVARLRARLKQLALEGEVGRQWHANSAAAILAYAKGDMKLAAKIAALIANFSPRTPVGLDLKNALTALVQYEAKQELNPGAPAEHTAGARHILFGVNKDGPAVLDDAGNVQPTGIKRINFFRNLMLGIDPINYNAATQGATIDMWMAHAFGYANDVMGSVNKSQYNYADAEVKRLARDLGWSVEETQAAIWVAIKARGNSARSHIERHAMNRGWYEQVAKTASELKTDLLGTYPADTKRVVKDDKQREFVVEWMRMALLNPISKEALGKANYDYARAFEDIYAGKIDLSDRIEDLPYAITKPADQDIYDLAPQMTLFSRAATVDMARQIRGGELEREQRMQAVADMLSQAKLIDNTFRQIFGKAGEAMGGGVKRWWLANVSTGNFISRFSQGYANVQKTLLTYVQRKSTLIAEGSRVALSEWHRASDADTYVVGEALLTRTENGYLASSPEYAELVRGMTEQQRKMFDQANQMIAGRLQHEFAVDQKGMRAILSAEEYNTWFENRRTQVEKLTAEGYVPERRYGDYTVHIYLPTADGKPPLTLFYEQFETEAVAKLAGEQYQAILARDAPDLKLEIGHRYRAERDTSLSIQQFLDTARRNGITLTQQERERIVKALVAADSSKRNRLMRRKNVPGYSRDIMRVLHEFVVTTSNKVAYAEMSTAINDAIEGRPIDARLEGGQPVVTVTGDQNLWKTDGPQAGFYRNLADQLTDYVLVPDHSGAWSQKLRGAAMFYFIGGSLAAGVVNSMSVPMNTIPWLSQSTGYANAFSTTLSSWAMVAKNQGELRDIARLKNKDVPMTFLDTVPGLRDALITASEDGTTMDTEIHQIMGMTQGGLLAKSRKVQRAAELWMSPFRFAEQINRITTFTAAYRVGLENRLGGRALYDFAKGVVDNTQNQYNEVNRPSVARHDVWALMFMFKSFPLFMVEMATIMYKQNPKSLVYFLLGLTMMTGMHGLPFAETIMDLIDTIAQRLFGSPFNTRRAMRNLVKDASEAFVGADLSELVLRGAVNDLTGMSIASRVGMGDFVPGTRLATADTNYARALADILGAPFSMVSDVAGASVRLAKGDFTEAMRESAPLAVRNLVKSYQQYDRGYAEDMQGRKLVDVTGPEVFWQSIGFSSANVNRMYELDRIDRQTLAFYQEVRTDFMTQLVKAIRDGNTEKAQETMEAIQSWNETYPTMPIGFRPSVIRRRIVEFGLPLNERTLRMMPRALRGTSTALEGAAQ